VDKKMEKSIKFLFLTILFISSSLIPIHLHSAENVKIQRVLDAGKVNMCILQDKDGLLWFGTEGEGLFCYDGNELKKIKVTENENSFLMIWSAFVDKEGVIWFLVQDQGLYSYNKHTGVCKKHKPELGNPNSLTSDNINWLPDNITEDKDALIWFGTTDGLNSFDKNNNKFTQYKQDPNNPNSLSDNNVWAVFVDKNGLIWIGTENGLNCYNKKTNKFFCYKNQPANSNSISDNHIRAIAEDKGGDLWIGTKDTGIDKFDKQTNTFTNYRHNPNNSNSLSYNEIHYIMVDRFNNLWICNEGGTGIDLYNIKANTFKHYSYDSKNLNSISSNDILYFFEDNIGIIWVVDSSGGIDKCVWKQDVFKNYSHEPKDPSSICSNNVLKLYEDKGGSIWIGTLKGGLSLYAKNGKFENFKPIANDPLSLPSSSVSSILGAPDSKLWLGFQDEIGSINLFDIASRRIIKSFNNPYTSCLPCLLTKDNKNPNVLWFASFGQGSLFKLNTISGKFTQYKHVPGDISSVSNENTFSILQDGNILWIGTGGDGLTKFNKKTGKCVHYKHDPNDKNSISGNIIFEIYIDSKGNFWVTTEDGGLNKFNRKTGEFTSYGINCGFSSNSTRHILEDSKGYLWVSTNSGIAKFNPSTSKVIKIFTKADGLPTNQLDRMANALKDSNGDFWFSTMRGVCKFNPEIASNVRQNLNVPPIVLSSFKSKEGTYDNRGFKLLKKVNLPWFDNSFEFTFAVLDYAEPDRNQYAYKLEGFDKDWNYIGTNHFGQYANLSSGDYILYLKGANSDGLWNEQGVSVKITIKPAFWQTWWFKGIISIIFLGTVLLIIRHRRKIQKKRVIATRDHAIANTTVIVAHDVRKPFTGLKMLLQMLPKLTSAQTKNYSEDLNLSIRKVDAMLTDIMEASREMRYELTPGNILSVLDLAIKEVSRYYPNKSIDFYYDLDTVALINLDDQRMCRTFENIIDNAFGFLPDKGGIMWFSVKGKNNKAEIIIGNTHSHISEDQVKKIFQDRFTSGKKGGTGLGLSIVTKVIKGHNGSVIARNVEKAPDFVSKEIRNIQGVEFEVALPLTEKSGYNMKDPSPKNSQEAKAEQG
jgi:ligand-binding sensor domain-containing protein/signal transduction histidine kinase